jgi:hypothetical protein
MYKFLTLIINLYVCSNLFASANKIAVKKDTVIVCSGNQKELMRASDFIQLNTFPIGVFPLVQSINQMAMVSFKKTNITQRITYLKQMRIRELSKGVSFFMKLLELLIFV